MPGLSFKGLRVKLMALLMIAAMVPCVAVGVVCFERGRSALELAEFAKLSVLWTAKRHEMIAWFARVVNDLASVAQSKRFRVGFEELVKPGRIQEGRVGAMKDLDEVIRGYLDGRTPEHGFDDLFLIDGKTGKILRGAKPLADRGSDKVADEQVDAGVQYVVKQVISLNRPAISDLEVNSATKNPSAVIGVPVFRLQTRECLGVLAIRINLNGMNKILDLESTQGGSSEVYFVGKDFLMRSRSRLSPESIPLKTRRETEAARQALGGKTVSTFTRGVSGGTNLSVAALVGMNKQKDFLADFDWVMVVEMDEKEAMGSVRSLAWWTAGIAGLTALIVSIAGFFVSAGVTAPVVAVANVAREVSRGNLTGTLTNSNRRDEIGTLIESFGIMINDLRDQIARIRETIEVVDASTAEISASISQVAVSTTETSAAVTQTTQTVKQVKHAAELAVDRARKVAQSSQVAVHITEDTRLNAEDRVQRIRLIKEQMESIGEIVVQLSDQSRSVEEIIATVQDLADQSNLLAVNASIEAARAGDQGRGFTVVAQEIKLLADQSKQATEQVRAILEDSRKLVSSVVMAAEQGNKAVEAGVEQSASAAESIERLAAGVTESAEAANAIEVTIDHEFAGVDQVLTAMTSIEGAMRNMMDGTEHVDQSAQRLAAVGSELRRMVARYKV